TNSTPAGQAGVKVHGTQPELGGRPSLDPEPWRGEPLLAYLRKMVFWSEVTPDSADMAVLSLLGPRLGDQAVLDALGFGALPAELGAPPAGGGFVRRMPDSANGQIELEVVVPRADPADWQTRLARPGVRSAGVWAFEAPRVVHRVAALRPRLGLAPDES